MHMTYPCAYPGQRLQLLRAGVQVLRPTRRLWRGLQATEMVEGRHLRRGSSA